MSHFMSRYPINNPQSSYLVTASGACAALVDMFILMDSSTSVDVPNYQKEKDFIKAFSHKFDMVSKRTRLGVISFSDNAEINIHLDDFNNVTRFVEKVNKIPWIMGKTSTTLALNKAYEALFGGQGAARPLVPRVIVLITDGSGTGSLREVLKKLRGKCTQLFGVGIGTKETDAKHVADEGKLIKVDNFSLLQDQVDNFVNMVCGGKYIFKIKSTDLRQYI